MLAIERGYNRLASVNFYANSPVECCPSSAFARGSSDTNSGSGNDGDTRIYTDWANHYLERNYNKLEKRGNNCEPYNGYGKSSKRFIENLSRDLKDGVLLLDIVESVTTSKVSSHRIKRKPEVGDQMVENIDLCLKHVRSLGISVDGIAASDIYSGNLKSILNLFYNLSRYKEINKTPATRPAQDTNFSRLGCNSQPTRFNTIHTISSFPSTNSIGSTSSTSTNSAMPSRLPQKRESKIPAPRHGSPSNMSNASVSTVGSKKLTGHALIKGEKSEASSRSSSRGSSPGIVGIASRGHSSSAHSQSSLIASPINGSVVVLDKKQGIRPPRPSSIPSVPNAVNGNGSGSMPATFSSTAKLNPTKARMVNNRVVNNNNGGRPSNEFKRSDGRGASSGINIRGSSTSSKGASSSSGFSSARSDSTPSLCESEVSEINGNISRVTPIVTKTCATHTVTVTTTSSTTPTPAGTVPRSRGIPPPRTRPTSACIENANPLAPQIISPPKASPTASGLRPLSSTGIPKSGLASVKEVPSPTSSTASPSTSVSTTLTKCEQKQPNRTESIHDPELNQGAVMSPNVARVSPIRRQNNEGREGHERHEKDGNKNTGSVPRNTNEGLLFGGQSGQEKGPNHKDASAVYSEPQNVFKGEGHLIALKQERRETLCSVLSPSLHKPFLSSSPSSPSSASLSYSSSTSSSPSSASFSKSNNEPFEPPFKPRISAENKERAANSSQEMRGNKLQEQSIEIKLGQHQDPISDQYIKGMSPLKKNPLNMYPNGYHHPDLNVLLGMSSALSPRSPSTQQQVLTTGGQTRFCGSEEAAYSDSECVKQKAKSRSLGANIGTSTMSHPTNPFAADAVNPMTSQKDIMENIFGHKVAINGSNRMPYTPAPDPAKYPSLRNLVTPPPTPAMSSASCQLRRLSKNSELRGSAASLLSGSSNFSATEEKQAQEIKKLRSELSRANEKVTTLTSQLITNAQMVAAFEQSLSSMTARLHQLSITSEHKDREVNRLKSTIETLRKEYDSVSSGLIDPSADSDRESKSKKKAKDARSSSRDREESKESAPGWLRGSITRAFRKGRNKGGESDSETGHSSRTADSYSVPNTPLMAPKVSFGHQIEEDELELSSMRKQLMDKERTLTDIRLEALSTAHQMEQMKEGMNKMRLEMESLRLENRRLQRLLQGFQRQSSISSIGSLTSCSDIGLAINCEPIPTTQPASGDFEAKSKPNAEAGLDPLLNTLMRLREAANGE